MNLGEKTKESLIEKIIEKDNEINDLRAKLSRLILNFSPKYKN